MQYFFSRLRANEYNKIVAKIISLVPNKFIRTYHILVIRQNYFANCTKENNPSIVYATGINSRSTTECIIHHDNTPSHSALSMTDFPAPIAIIQLYHATYLPHLVIYDF